MMVEKGIKSIKNDRLSVVLIPETVSTTFDSKKLQAENPSVYEKYTKQTKRKRILNSTLNMNNVRWLCVVL